MPTGGRRQAGDALDQALVRAVLDQPVHDGGIELECVHRQTLHRRQRGRAGAERGQCDVQAERAQRFQRTQQLARIGLLHLGFAQLDREPLRQLRGEGRQQPLQERQEARAQQPRHRLPNADRQGLVFAAPLRQLGQHGTQAPVLERLFQLAAAHMLQDVVRLKTVVLGLGPAHPGFDGADGAVDQVDAGQVDQAQLFALQRLLQLLAHVIALSGQRVADGIVEAERPATVLLHGVADQQLCLFGMGQQQRGLRSIGRAQGHTDADGRAEVVAVDRHRLAGGSGQAREQRHAVLGVAHVAEQRDKAARPDAGQGVVGTQRRAQVPGNALDHAISHLLTQARRDQIKA